MNLDRRMKLVVRRRLQEKEEGVRECGYRRCNHVLYPLFFHERLKERIFFFLKHEVRLGKGKVEEKLVKVYGECGLAKVVDGRSAEEGGRRFSTGSHMVTWGTM